MSAAPATSADVTALIAAGCRALWAAGQADLIWGHCSVRDPGGRGAWMKGSGWASRNWSWTGSSWFRPTATYWTAPAVGTSSTRSTPRSWPSAATSGPWSTRTPTLSTRCALDVPLRPLDHAGCLFTYPEIPRFTLTGGLIRSRDLGQALAATLAAGPACLMPQHGLVAVGADLPSAVMTAVLLDRACRTQLTAMAAGPLGERGGYGRQARHLGCPSAASRVGLPASRRDQGRPVRDLVRIHIKPVPGHLSADRGRSNGGMNSCSRMPFRRRALRTLKNEHPVDLDQVFLQVDYTLKDRLSDETAYLHAQGRRTNGTRALGRTTSS
jgi:ribulose-5-phosphate 4-epimerase/fuculose-1-phosphate aldolase